MKNLLAKKAMLASLTICQWSARRLDKRITDEVNESHNAISDAGRYNKLLIKKSALEPIWRISTEARTYHATVTMPWLDKAGTRLLPAKLFEEYLQRMNKLRTDFERAADEFAEAYPDHVKARQKELNGLFNDKDYPSWKKVRSLFSFEPEIMPCPDAGDFRVDLADGHVADIKRQVEARMKRALDEAMQEPVRRIVDVVGHMAARLAAYKPAEEKGERSEGVFRDTLVGNVRELVDILPGFNLTDCPNLNTLTARMQRELCVEDAKTLREQPLTREVVAKSAESILDMAKQFLA